MVSRLKNRKRVASIAGDLATTIDADRIRSAGAEVVQVNTGNLCHLDAHLVQSVLPRLRLDGLDVLLIENVGNLICPGEFPLGAHKRLVVVSFTEGPYMVKKHPAIFLGADVLAVNKSDLARAMGVDGEALAADAREIKPGLPVVFTSARDGAGVNALLEALGLGAS
jgi:hydrogenase nickel incorporation protein HypB